MAYRRREPGRYSSADAYRSVHNPGNTGRDPHPLPALPAMSAPAPAAASSSSEEEALNPRGRADTPSPPGYDRTGTREESPLSPPRPHFLGGRARRESPAAADRRSWSSTGDSLEPASDSDAGTDREGGGVNMAGVGARQAQQQPIMSRRARAGTAGSQHQQAAPTSPTSPTGSVRARNHRRRSSDLPVPVPVPASPTTSSQSSHQMLPGPGARRPSVSSTPSSAHANPFDTPPPERRGAPPSAFPFLSHAGNPDPGTPLPVGGSLARRPSHESFRRAQAQAQAQGQAGTVSAPGYAYNNNVGYNNMGSNNGMTPTTPGFPITPGAGAQGYSALRGSMDVTTEEDALGRPYAPFMGEGASGEQRQSWSSAGGGGSPGVGNGNGGGGGGSVYRNSAAAAMAGSNTALAGSGESPIPRTNSQPQIAMRAPFLSPASRPTSSLWSPPSYPSYPALPSTGSGHLTSAYPPSLTYLPTGLSSSPHLLPRKARPPMPSSRLARKLTLEDKPWIRVRDRRERCAWWLTFVVCWVGVAASAVVIFFGWTGVRQLKDDQLCLVMDEEFNSGGLDSGSWSQDVELGGFGNGEFQMTTDSSTNLFFKNGQLYIMPTLTTDAGYTAAQIVGNDSATYKLDGCTAGTASSSDGSSASANCTVTSGSGPQDVIPPVQSARINTKGKKSIRYGKVEVRAKLPAGDWLWPAIWMLPEEEKYGAWPLSGEIDIMEARGNPQSYPAQGANFVRSSLNYGPMATLQTHLIGWWQEKRYTYAQGFHTYALEWTPDWMRFYVDSRLQAMMNVAVTGKGGKSFFERAAYPATAINVTGEVVPVLDVWAEEGGGASAPFDQAFYLILDVAAGGTSGWFPDGVGGKPWFDGDAGAMRAFAEEQKAWSATWPQSEDDRAMRVDSVKMWSLKQGGNCPS